MKEQQTININPNIPKALIIGLFLSFSTVFIVEHFGNFDYTSEYSYTNYPINYYKVHCNFKTPFNNYFSISEDDYTKLSSENKYHDKVKIYLSATFKDYKYIILFSLGYIIFSFILLNYKIRFSTDTKGISLK